MGSGSHKGHIPMAGVPSCPPAAPQCHSHLHCDPRQPGGHQLFQSSKYFSSLAIFMEWHLVTAAESSGNTNFSARVQLSKRDTGGEYLFPSRCPPHPRCPPGTEPKALVQAQSDGQTEEKQRRMKSGRKRRQKSLFQEKRAPKLCERGRGMRPGAQPAPRECHRGAGRELLYYYFLFQLAFFL